MRRVPDRPADPGTRLEELARRRREALLIIATGLAVFVFALWEIRRPGADDGAAGNVFSFLLVNLNLVLLLLLVFLVLRNLLKLYLERRVRLPGSQLRSRLVMAFVAIAAFPAVVMLMLSLEFSTNAIDGWFNTEVESSLRGAWQLAQTYYREAGDDAVRHARALSRQAETIGLEKNRRSRNTLERLVRDYQETYGLGTVQIVDRAGSEMLSVFSVSTPTGLPLGIDQALLAEVLEDRSATRVEPLGASDVVRGAAAMHDEQGAVTAMVVVDYLVDESPRVWSEQIVESFREYRSLQLNKRPFKNLYVLTMALASLVVIFSATWLGLYLARSITEPLGRVVAATRRIAEGDWEARVESVGSDEIGTLVDAFNSMTAELRASHAELETHSRFIQNVLNNIDAGVISVDGSGSVSTVNPAALSLLGLREDALVGRNVKVMLEASGYPEVATLLEDLERGAVSSGARLNVHREDESRTLLMIATSLERDGGGRAGYVLFVQDVAQIEQVQRMEAWREVARRIAHEIKNPLTPIQLSAQRLQRRLHGRVSGEEGQLVDECTGTIVKEVEGLKHLVNEFSQFARRTSSEKKLHDLNAIVEETMPLYRQARPDLALAVDLEPNLPRVSMDRESVKRALVNLLENAVAAVGTGAAGTRTGVRADVVVRTRHEAALSRVVLEVIDAGTGIAPEHRTRVLEPYFSTKPDGTGLGLAIVASVAADHQAYLRLHDEAPHGTRIVIEFPVGMAEKKT